MNALRKLRELALIQSMLGAMTPERAENEPTHTEINWELNRYRAERNRKNKFAKQSRKRNRGL